MTAQIHDSCAYHGQTYSITGVNGRGLFDPADHHIEPEPHSTACWRGYHCDYVVEDERLIGIVSIGDVVNARVTELEIERQQLTDYISGR